MLYNSLKPDDIYIANTDNSAGTGKYLLRVGRSSRKHNILASTWLYSGMKR